MFTDRQLKQFYRSFASRKNEIETHFFCLKTLLILDGKRVGGEKTSIRKMCGEWRRGGGGGVTTNFYTGYLCIIERK